MVGLLKYGAGLPFHRLEGLQEAWAFRCPRRRNGRSSKRPPRDRPGLSGTDPAGGPRRGAAQRRHHHESAGHDEATQASRRATRKTIGAQRHLHFRDRINQCGTKDRAVLHRPQACRREPDRGAGRACQRTGPAYPNVRCALTQLPGEFDTVVANASLMRDENMWSWPRRSRPRCASCWRSCVKSISPMRAPATSGSTPGSDCVAPGAERAAHGRARAVDAGAFDERSSSRTPRSARRSSTCKSDGRS